MWLLKKVSEEGPVQYLVSEKKFYTVGRKNTDIVLSDNSVSRTHCILNVAVKNECPFSVNTITGVWIIDKKSKYGTFIQKNYEWIKIEEEKVEQLSNGSIIRFGVLENIWRLEYKPVIACSSRLSNTQMGEMKRLLATIDGRIVSKWVKQCNVVFVNDITLTVKVLLALINGIPIVTMNYLTKLVECVKQNQGWPDYKLFRPEIKESTLIPSLVSLDVEDHRKELFKGKTFVIPTNEQLENLRDIIEAAGGRVELLKLDGNWRQLVNENVIVVQLPCDKIINPDKNASSFRNMASVLKNEYHTRVVPETEIFQAIAYSSTEKYCSPRSAAFDLRQCSSNQHSQGHVLEEETPTQSNVRMNVGSENF
ncbi:UNVERIFIED_CONTAM: hypothetical protein PYX00_005355 [Menopon gallinae]|uniref:FHA domain-containing protein n=1 Tax=Menopon gallinae TaxID=328185 RepID=A0AAW2HSB5_9NEOP